jgi:hypothetical protein
MYVIEEEENKEKSCIRMKEIIVNYQKKEWEGGIEITSAAPP